MQSLRGFFNTYFKSKMDKSFFSAIIFIVIEAANCSKWEVGLNFFEYIITSK